MQISWFKEAWDDYIFWQSINRKTVKRIHDLIKDIERNHYSGIGKPEQLKGDKSGWWSRRIDDRHRLVYSVEGDIIRILSCRSHYGD